MTTNTWKSNRTHGNAKNLYLSFDIEADGPAPNVNSMISIGIYGFDGMGKEVVSYQRNIEPHPTRVVDKRTKEEFWDKHPEMYKFIQTKQATAEETMNEIAKLYKSYIDTGYRVNWVAWPSAYDWQWLNCYYHEFGPPDKPYIGFSAKCASTARWIYCKNNPMSDKEYNTMLENFAEGEKATHNPLDDARYQGKISFNLFDKMQVRL